MNAIWTLLRKDALLDIRSGSSLGSIVLYVVASCFIIYLAFQDLTGPAWVVLFWLVVLFSTVNSALQSFSGEGVVRQLYYFTLVGPHQAIAAKLLYNIMATLITVVLTACFLSLFSGFPIVEVTYFGCIAFLGAIGIAASFTLVSGIVFRSRNQSTLMMVMAFPVIIPVLLPLIKASRTTLEKTDWSAIENAVLVLGGMDLLIVSLVVFLFPFVWRE
ncbi:MAG: heme exporter protein CcmB [Saprospiraceae bacterium]|nr:heme exporter protein CcmB [Saprospiraceae bacterium]